jgi:hypothetical protein
MTLQGPFFFFQRKLIADLALKQKLPLVMSEALAGDAGALLQVNPDVPGAPPPMSIVSGKERSLVIWPSNATAASS